jgi:integrase
MAKVRLTKKVVEAIAPGERDVIVWDEDLQGFGVKVTPSGRRTYFCYFRTLAGQERRPSIGLHGTLTCDEARGIAKDMLADVRKGNDPSQNRQEQRRAPTLAEFSERYLSDHARTKKKPLSVEADERNLANHVLPALGNKKLPSITRADVARFHQSMKDTPGAANRCLMLLSKMFNLAELWGVRPDGSNPCRLIEKYAERKIERYLSPEELGRLGAVLLAAEKVGDVSAPVIAAIRLLIFTGCRREEILTLRWEHVDRERQCLRLPDSKTGAKSVQLNAAALDVLERIPRRGDDPWVISGSKAGNHLINIEKPWRRVRDRAGLSDVRLHDLRHSFASVGAAAGLGLPMIGALLGHKEAATTQRYAHLAADPLRAANELIGQEIAKAMGRPK